MEYLLSLLALFFPILIIAFFVYHYLLWFHWTPQWFLSYIMQFFITTLTLPITIKRTHDLGHPWYISLFMYINFIAWIYVLFLLLIKWDKWPNKYWSDPLEKIIK